MVDPMVEILRKRALLGGADPKPLLGTPNLFGENLPRSRPVGGNLLTEL